MGGGFVFQLGGGGEGGFIFKWEVRPMGGISFDGGVSKKIVGWGEGEAAPQHAPPTMGNPDIRCHTFHLVIFLRIFP